MDECYTDGDRGKHNVEYGPTDSAKQTNVTTAAALEAMVGDDDQSVQYKSTMMNTGWCFVCDPDQ